MADKRNRKSKQALKQAMIELVKIKSYSSVTISELCQKADVNRSTFYANYGGINELILDIYHDFFEEMYEKRDTNWEQLQDIEEEQKLKILEKDISYFKNNRKNMEIFTKYYKDPLFINAMTDFFQKTYCVNEQELQKEYQFLYDLMGSFALIQRWMQTGCPISEKELAKYILQLSKHTNEKG